MNNGNHFVNLGNGELINLHGCQIETRHLCQPLLSSEDAIVL